MIDTGPGLGLREVPPARADRIFQWLFDLGRNVPCAIKTTEATRYRRIAVNRLRQAELSEEQIAGTPEGRRFGIRDGNGILFISHTGDVYPARFLPIVAGNLRSTPLVHLHREGDVFRRLRDVHLLKGKCAPASTPISVAACVRAPTRERPTRSPATRCARTFPPRRKRRSLDAAGGPRGFRATMIGRRRAAASRS